MNPTIDLWGKPIGSLNGSYRSPRFLAGFVVGCLKALLYDASGSPAGYAYRMLVGFMEESG